MKRKGVSTVSWGAPALLIKCSNTEVFLSDKLWSFCEIVVNPCDQRSYLNELQFTIQQSRQDGIEGAGEVEEHNVDYGVGSVQRRVCLLQHIIASLTPTWG